MMVQDLSVHVNGQWLLHHVSFDLDAGEFLAVIGPNGAGKSTLLKAVLDLLPRQSGSITYATNKSQVGYVPQSRQIDPDSPLNVWDFVSFGLGHRLFPWLTHDDKRHIDEALDLTDCMSFAQRPVGKLSGGQKQRVYLAQALVREPQVLLLDEPTANLDPGAQTKVADVIANICKTRGVSVIFVTHDINLAARYATRVLYLTHGQYALGTVPEVMNATVLSALYGMPIQLLQVGSEMLLVAQEGRYVSV